MFYRLICRLWQQLSAVFDKLGKKAAKVINTVNLSFQVDNAQLPENHTSAETSHHHVLRYLPRLCCFDYLKLLSTCKLLKLTSLVDVLSSYYILIIYTRSIN